MSDQSSQFDETSADDALAVAAAGGSLAAFEILVRRYQVPLLHMLIARCRQRHLAEDTLQNAFLKMFRAMNGFNPAMPFRTWAFAIAHRCLIDAVRADPISETSRSIDHCQATNLSPDWQRAESTQRLWEIARRALSAEQLSALWLFYVEQMPTAQIAEVIDRSDAWVRTALSRARITLAPQLQPIAEEIL